MNVSQNYLIDKKEKEHTLMLQYKDELLMILCQKIMYAIHTSEDG